MKRIATCILIGVLGSTSLGVFNSRGDLEVSASVQIHAEADFYAPLTPYGTWVEVGSYGRCWRPSGIAVEWRPYCSGHWVWTDCGWYWASDEPWAWACYHYGSWAYDFSAGWVWVPAIEWAPAWVEWRFGGGYCGWAPLAPHGVVIAPRAFVFVEARHFHDSIRPSTVIVNNTTIINQTTVVGGVKRETVRVGGAAPQQVVVNQGPGVDVIQKATGRTVSAVPIREAAKRTPIPSEAARKIHEARRNESPASLPGTTPAPRESRTRQKETLAPPATATTPGKYSEPPRPKATPAPDKYQPAAPHDSKPPATATTPGNYSEPPRPKATPAPEKYQPAAPHDSKPPATTRPPKDNQPPQRGFRPTPERAQPPIARDPRPPTEARPGKDNEPPRHAVGPTPEKSPAPAPAEPRAPTEARPGKDTEPPRYGAGPTRERSQPPVRPAEKRPAKPEKPKDQDKDHGKGGD